MRPAGRTKRKGPPTAKVSGPLLPRFFLLHASPSDAGKAEQPKAEKEYCAALWYLDEEILGTSLIIVRSTRTHEEGVTRGIEIELFVKAFTTKVFAAVISAAVRPEELGTTQNWLPELEFVTVGGVSSSRRTIAGRPLPTQQA